MDRRTSLRLLGFATLAAILGVPATLRGTRRDTARTASMVATGEGATAPPHGTRDGDDPADARPQRPVPEPAPEPPPAAEPAPPTIEVICRDAVGLAAPGPHVRPHDVTHLTLHHSGVVIDDSTRVPERLRGHQRHHQAQGWPDIAYHFGVDLAGNVYELRDPAWAGDTFTGYDPTGHIGVLCEGDFDRQAPTEVMLDALASLFAHLASAHRVPMSRLTSHRDHATTACPGQGLYRELAGLRDIVGAHLDDSPPAVRRLCGADGERVVASIEGLPS